MREESGSLVCEALRKNGLRQADVARALGVSQAAVSKKMRRRSRWSFQDVDLLNDLLPEGSKLRLVCEDEISQAAARFGHSEPLAPVEIPRSVEGFVSRGDGSAFPVDAVAVARRDALVEGWLVEEPGLTREVIAARLGCSVRTVAAIKRRLRDQGRLAGSVQEGVQKRLTQVASAHPDSPLVAEGSGPTVPVDFPGVDVPLLPVPADQEGTL